MNTPVLEAIWNKFNKNKHIFVKPKNSERFNQAKALNSEQKMLFTFNNPELKEGDIDVEEINFESDDDVCEEMENFSPVWYRKSNGRKSQKIIQNDINRIPNSLLVNNSDHSKVPNIFLLWDRICGNSKSSLSAWLSAVSNLESEELNQHNKENYNNIINEISCCLNKIKYQLVLNKVLGLLQRKGTETTLENMKIFIEPVYTYKTIQESYENHNHLSLIHREWTQQLLREWVANLESLILFNSVNKERKPFKKLRHNNRSHIKSESRSVSRPCPINKIMPKQLTDDNDINIFTSKKNKNNIDKNFGSNIV